MTRYPRPHCPHQNVAHCTLYIASHDGRLAGYGCDDGKLDIAEGCAVSRGKDYGQAVEALEAVAPTLNSFCQLRRHAAELLEQRDRNMRSNGIH